VESAQYFLVITLFYLEIDGLSNFISFFILRHLLGHTNVFFKNILPFFEGLSGVPPFGSIAAGFGPSTSSGTSTRQQRLRRPSNPGRVLLSRQKILRRRGAPLVPRKRDEGYRRAEGR